MFSLAAWLPESLLPWLLILIQFRSVSFFRCLLRMTLWCSSRCPLHFYVALGQILQFGEVKIIWHVWDFLANYSRLAFLVAFGDFLEFIRLILSTHIIAFIMDPTDLTLPLIWYMVPLSQDWWSRMTQHCEAIEVSLCRTEGGAAGTLQCRMCQEFIQAEKAHAILWIRQLQQGHHEDRFVPTRQGPKLSLRAGERLCRYCPRFRAEAGLFFGQLSLLNQAWRTGTRDLVVCGLTASMSSRYIHFISSLSCWDNRYRTKERDDLVARIGHAPSLSLSSTS